MTPTNNLKAFPKIYASESDYVHKTFEDYLKAAEENYDKGFEPLQTLPASWYNSLLYLLTEQAQATKVLCDSIFAELQSVLSAGGVEPSAAHTNQLLTAIETITKLNTATASMLGGIKSSSANWAVQVDPATSIASVNTVNASTGTKGIVQLEDSITSTDTTKAATANAVKKAVEAATPGIATSSTPGLIKSSSANWAVQVDSSTSIASVNTVNASTGTKGIVQLDDSINSTDTTKAATANAVRQAFANGVYRGTCSTGWDVQEKQVGIAGPVILQSNMLLAVYFTHGNNAPNPTLNVNNTGAKPIRYNHTKLPAGGMYNTWLPGETVLFRYDGSYWNMLKTSAMNLDDDILYIEF